MREFIVHQKPDPEVIIKCLYGTTSKGLAEKIKRGEVELPKAGEGQANGVAGAGQKNDFERRVYNLRNAR